MENVHFGENNGEVRLYLCSKDALPTYTYFVCCAVGPSIGWDCTRASGDQVLFLQHPLLSFLSPLTSPPFPLPLPTFLFPTQLTDSIPRLTYTCDSERVNRQQCHATQSPQGRHGHLLPGHLPRQMAHLLLPSLQEPALQTMTA